MTVDRLKQLEQFYKDEPGDPFNAYALALEYGRSDVEKARVMFDMLLAQHPSYLPTYYHAAGLYRDRGDREKAAEIFEAGIALAKQQRDPKTQRELQSAYDEMMFE